MPSCGTCVAAAVLRGELDKVPPDVGYVVIPFSKLYVSCPDGLQPVSIFHRLFHYLQSERCCVGHIHQPIPTLPPLAPRRKRALHRGLSELRRSFNLIVPVFYILRIVQYPNKLMSKFATMNAYKRWVHVVPEGAPSHLDQVNGMQIMKYEQNILRAILNFHQPALFHAMLVTWPTMTTQPAPFDWAHEWSDDLSMVLHDELPCMEYLVIAIRHGLDVNQTQEYHVIDKLRDNVRDRCFNDPYALNFLPLLVTYGLTDFRCEAKTPMRFILHFDFDYYYRLDINQWHGTEIANAMIILESVGYQYLLPEGVIELEMSLIKKWVRRQRKIPYMQEHLDRIMNRPLTLTEISRNKIRNNLGGSYLCKKATKLGLPPALVKVVTMEDIRNSLLFDGRSPAEI